MPRSHLDDLFNKKVSTRTPQIYIHRLIRPWYFMHYVYKIHVPVYIMEPAWNLCQHSKLGVASYCCWKQPSKAQQDEGENLPEDQEDRSSWRLAVPDRLTFMPRYSKYIYII